LDACGLFVDFGGLSDFWQGDTQVSVALAYKVKLIYMRDSRKGSGENNAEM